MNSGAKCWMVHLIRDMALQGYKPEDNKVPLMYECALDICREGALCCEIC